MNEAMDPTLRPKLVASYRHFLGFLGIVAAVLLAGLAAQQRATVGGGLASAHQRMIPLYLSAIFMNGMLVYFVWGGVRRHGGNLFDLIGGRWTGWRDLGSDLALAAPFWMLFKATAWSLAWLLGQDHAKTLDILLPRGGLEVSMWITTSAMAGFSEELVFRGYVQRQILAMSGSTFVAVIGQGVLFGLMHAYQGWKATV